MIASQRSIEVTLPVDDLETQNLDPCQAEPMAHHKRKRPKHRRNGCLLCKPHKLTANVKAKRRRDRSRWTDHENSAW
jgi:hypothetical protein